jgi:hypothetical protein
VLGKDSEELEKYLEKKFTLPEEEISTLILFNTQQPSYQCIFVGGVPIFFYFHIWTTEVIPYNALNLEFANFETPCILIFYNNKLEVVWKVGIWKNK